VKAATVEKLETIAEFSIGFFAIVAFIAALSMNGCAP
jgi:hypothetical protein